MARKKTRNKKMQDTKGLEEVRTYRTDGKLKEHYWVDAVTKKRQGLYASFDATGEKVSEKWYNEGKLHGRYIRTIQPCQEKSVGGYSNGKREGLWKTTNITYYYDGDPSNNVVEILTRYENGVILWKYSCYTNTRRPRWFDSKDNGSHCRRFDKVLDVMNMWTDCWGNGSYLTCIPNVGIMGTAFLKGIPDMSGYFHYDAKIASSFEEFIAKRRETWDPIHWELLATPYAPENVRLCDLLPDDSCFAQQQSEE